MGAVPHTAESATFLDMQSHATAHCVTVASGEDVQVLLVSTYEYNCDLGSHLVRFLLWRDFNGYVLKVGGECRCGRADGEFAG